jgi:homoserine kinase type II
MPELDLPRFAAWVADQWEIHIKSVRRDVIIQGSPERSLSRGVIQDTQGNCFLVEKFDPAKYKVRRQVADTLYYLCNKGLDQALAPEKTKKGELLPSFGEDFFQITKFLNSTGVLRPQWLSSASMGEELAGFLVKMHGIPPEGGVVYPPFSIKGYIYKLFEDMANHNIRRHSQYLPVLKFLEQGFMQAHDSLNLQFCHGDYHPLNIIWEGHKIKAVIDWEFTGIKPDCYDAANLVGCAGIEHPEGLAMPMVTRFISRIKASDLISPLGWKWFPEYILALRFAWLSEWLRKSDSQMLETEFRFMEILIQHMDELRDIWTLT